MRKDKKKNRDILQFQLQKIEEKMSFIELLFMKTNQWKYINLDASMFVVF